MDYLAFEQPIADLEADLHKLEQEDDNSAATAERIRNLQQELNKTVRQIFDNLTPWQVVQDLIRSTISRWCSMSLLNYMAIASLEMIGRFARASPGWITSN